MVGSFNKPDQPEHDLSVRCAACARLTMFCLLCRLLGLPQVEVDALGRPTWECTNADVSRAYRKLSTLVHPDKAATAQHPDGREAFERLNDAARLLKDPAKRADEVAARVETARKRRALQDGAAGDMSARVVQNAARASEAAVLRQVWTVLPS